LPGVAPKEILKGVGVGCDFISRLEKNESATNKQSPPQPKVLHRWRGSLKKTKAMEVFLAERKRERAWPK
jgi:hypothetical protein